MLSRIRAHHLASFLEHDGALSESEILNNLKTVSNLPHSTVLGCRLDIIDNDYLTVLIENDRDPSECFDLKCIGNVSGFTSTSEGGNFSYLLVFRFYASDLTEGEFPNEVHVFNIESKSKLKEAVNTIYDAVCRSRLKNKISRKMNKERRSVIERKDAIARPKKMHGVPKTKNGGPANLLEELNHMLDQVEQFETNLHDSIAFRVARSSKSNRSLWRDSLCPPPLEYAIENIERIRSCINITCDLSDMIEDPGPGDLLNRIFESLLWIQQICDSRKIKHYDTYLIRSVWRPTFNEKTIRTLQDCLNSSNKVFWSNLGEAWITSDGRPIFPTYSDSKSLMNPDTIQRNGIRQEGPVISNMPEYGYYKSNITDSLEPSLPSGQPIDIDGFIDGVRERNGKLVVSRQKYISQTARELSVNVGDVLEILDDGEEWCCLRTALGTTGHVPKSILKHLEEPVNPNEDLKSCRNKDSKMPRNSQNKIDTRKVRIKNSTLDSVNSSCEKLNPKRSTPYGIDDKNTEAWQQEPHPQVQYASPNCNYGRGKKLSQRSYSQPPVIMVTPQSMQVTRPYVIAAQNHSNNVHHQPAIIQPNQVIVPVPLHTPMVPQMYNQMYPSMMTMPQSVDVYPLMPMMPSPCRRRHFNEEFHSYSSDASSDYDDSYRNRHNKHKNKRRTHSKIHSRRSSSRRKSKSHRNQSFSSSSSQSFSGSDRKVKPPKKKHIPKEHVASKADEDEITAYSGQRQPLSQTATSEPAQDHRTFDIITQNVKKQRLLSQLNGGRKLPQKQDTINKELRMRILQVKSGDRDFLRSTQPNGYESSHLSNSIDGLTAQSGNFGTAAV